MIFLAALPTTELKSVVIRSRSEFIQSNKGFLGLDNELELDWPGPLQNVVVEVSDPEVALCPLGSDATRAGWVPSSNYLMAANEPELLSELRLVSDSDADLLQVHWKFGRLLLNYPVIARNKSRLFHQYFVKKEVLTVVETEKLLLRHVYRVTHAEILT